MQRGNRLVLTSTAESDMTPEDALTVGTNVGSIYRSVAVAIDAAPGSGMIRSAFVAGLIAAGARVIEAGIAPTPAVCYAFKETCDCIAMIGSPNDYGVISGITLYNPDGSGFSTEQLRQILETGRAPLPDWQGLGTIRRDHGANTRYLERMAAGGLKADGYVIVDCGCGSTSLCAPAALAAAGADVASVNSHVDGRHVPRSPGIGRTELTSIEEFVNASVGSIGIAYNGDGTRLALIDESGKFVSGERVLALMLMYLRPRTAVIPFDAPGIVDYAFRQDIRGNTDGAVMQQQRRLIRVRGTLNDVTAAVRQNHADLGALADGTFIFPENSLCPDAIRASAVLSDLAGVRSLRDILASFPTYYSATEQIRYQGNQGLFGRNLLQKLREYDIDEILVVGGWRVVMKHGWFIVSADERDPDYIHITAESTDKVYLVTMMEQAKAIVRACV